MKSSVHVTILLCIGCAEKSPPTAVRPPTEVVARVGTESFSVQDIEARIAEQPEFVRARYQTPEHKRELIDTLVREQLLLSEARRQGLDKSPEVKSAFEKVMVQKLLQTELQNVAPTDAEARSWYDAHQQEFVRPERVRIAHVMWPASEKASAAKEREKLTKLKPDFQSAAFVELAQRASRDESTRAAGGELGIRAKDELLAQWGVNLAEAAFSLKNPGELSALIESPKGLHLIRLVGRQPSQEQSFDDARGRIAARLAGEARTQRLDALVERLKKTVAVEVDEKNLAKISVPTKGPLLPQ